MARLPDLLSFGAKYGIRTGTIADLISYRLKNDPTVEKISEQILTLKQGPFRSIIYRDIVEGGVHMALVHGNIDPDKPTPVRVHVHRGLLDVVLEPDSPWSWTLENALEVVAGEESGVVVLLSYTETADELVNRIDLNNRAEGRRKVNIKEDSGNLRMLGAGGQILANLGVSQVLALGSEKKAHGLSGFGLEIVEYISDPKQLDNWKPS